MCVYIYINVLKKIDFFLKSGLRLSFRYYKDFLISELFILLCIFTRIVRLFICESLENR